MHDRFFAPAPALPRSRGVRGAHAALLLLAVLGAARPGRGFQQGTPRPPIPAGESREQRDLEKLAARPQPNPFEIATEAVRTQLSARLAEQHAALAAGDLAPVIAALRTAAPESATNPAQALALGDALFTLAPADARAAHAKAHELAPKERAVLVAWGRELQREGRLSEAAHAYGEALGKEHPDALLLHGLRGACQIAAGAIDEALASWQAANPLQVRADLERNLREIHGDGDKEAQRRALLVRARAGDLDALEPLIVLDLSWSGQGDYPLSNREYVARDLALAAEKLGKESRRWVELEFLANGRMGMEPRPKDAPPAPEIPAGRGEGTGFGAALPPSPVEKAARKLGFMGWGKENKRFPVSSALAPSIYRMLFLDGDIVSSEWIGWFEGEMQARARSEKGDLEAALLLMELYRQTVERKFDGWDKIPERQAEWETYVWGRYKDPRVAERLLAGRATTLAPDDPVLKEALEHCGSDPEIVGFALSAARRAGAVTEALLVKRVLAALADENVHAATEAMTELRTLRDKKASESSAPVPPK